MICHIPEGERGPWRVERFEVTEHEARLSGLRAMFQGRGAINSGIYTKLEHAQRGVVMSDSPDEMRDFRYAISRARGHVLVNGLGLGLVVAGMLRKLEVSKLTVIEVDPDIIALVGPHLVDPRLDIVQESAFDYRPPANARYGAVWHDIWDTLCGDNLPDMTRLKRKYGRRTDWQGCWGEEYIRRRNR